MKTLKNTFLIKLFLLLILSGSVYAQELSLGTDIVNRYVWRGIDFGNAPHIMPSLEFSAGGFAAGFWAAYPTSTSAEETGSGLVHHSGGSEEIDFYLSYGFDLGESGGLSLGITDYMFPTSGFEFSNFNNYDNEEGPGSHYLELNAGYSGPESFPISLSFNMFFHNVENNPIYVQLGYTTSISDVGFDVFIGATPGEETMYYGDSTDSFSIINLGVTASKEIKVTEDFSIPVFGSVILNPTAEILYFVFGLSL